MSVDTAKCNFCCTVTLSIRRLEPPGIYFFSNCVSVSLMVAQYFSSTFGLGITGYVYEQISGDDGILRLVLRLMISLASGAGALAPLR